MMTIRDLPPNDVGLVEQLAGLLVEGFREHWADAWPDLPAARQEVHECLAPDRICLGALDEQGRVAGWIGGLLRGYDRHVWELHPLVVDRGHWRQGIGRALVAALETRVREQSGLTLTVGSDDEDNRPRSAALTCTRMSWATWRGCATSKAILTSSTRSAALS
jgi:aminoglycoside 6'-N-acetyltransferase I